MDVCNVAIRIIIFVGIKKIKSNKKYDKKENDYYCDCNSGGFGCAVCGFQAFSEGWESEVFL